MLRGRAYLESPPLASVAPHISFRPPLLSVPQISPPPPWKNFCIQPCPPKELYKQGLPLTLCSCNKPLKLFGRTLKKALPYSRVIRRPTPLLVSPQEGNGRLTNNVSTVYIAVTINLVGQNEKLARKCPVTDCYYEHCVIVFPHKRKISFNTLQQFQAKAV